MTKKLLSHSKSVPTTIGIICLAAFLFAFISLLLQFLNYGAIRRLSKKAIVLVQLSSGTTITAKQVNPDERSDEVLKKFVTDTFVRMFSWDGLIQTFNNKGEPSTNPDKGIEIKGNRPNLKVTSKAYEAAFAISENQNFRAAFLEKLAILTPPGVFQGNTQASLIPRYVSDPRKIKEGKWEVDLIATLVIFTASNNSGQGIAFNKTVTVQAVNIPQEFPSGTSELSKRIYEARRAGLEITQIIDLKK